MNKLKLAALIPIFSMISCSSQNSGSGATTTVLYSCSKKTDAGLGIGSTNVVPIKVGCGYINQPCISVKVCVPGTSTCEVIDNILLDTGSYGLRLFNCATSLSLPSQTIISSGTSYPLVELVSYADHTCDWGPIKLADVILGSQTASNIPIQIVSPSDYPAPSRANSVCTRGLESSATGAGFNGILGVGLFSYDCGNTCTITSANNQYYICNSSGCSGAMVPLNQQVRNPVSAGSTHNNGVVLTFPSVATTGAGGVTGTLTLGIGTAANNVPGGGVTAYTADSRANFRTVFGGTEYTSSFIDSGSNLLDFPNISNAGLNMPMSLCTGNAAGLYCPASTNNLSAQARDASGAPTSAAINFSIINADTYVYSGSGFTAYSGLGAPFSSGFDWGFPFFLGRTVYVQIGGTTSTLGSPTYGLWAF